MIEAGDDIEIPFSKYKVPSGGSSESNRTGRAFWSILADDGVPADLERLLLKLHRKNSIFNQSSRNLIRNMKKVTMKPGTSLSH